MLNEDFNIGLYFLMTPPKCYYSSSSSFSTRCSFNILRISYNLLLHFSSIRKCIRLKDTLRLDHNDNVCISSAFSESLVVWIHTARHGHISFHAVDWFIDGHAFRKEVLFSIFSICSLHSCYVLFVFYWIWRWKNGFKVIVDGRNISAERDNKTPITGHGPLEMTHSAVRGGLNLASRTIKKLEITTQKVQIIAFRPLFCYSKTLQAATLQPVIFA